jgi:hypothetical protein
MAGDHHPQTLGSLLAALVKAKTHGRDFYLTMIEAFVYLPDVADVWRSLMFEECMQLHMLREFEGGLMPALGSQPVEREAVRRAESVPAILSSDRIRTIQTLEDAHRLLTEYELSGLSEMVGQVAAALSKEPGSPPVEAGEVAGAQGRLAATAKRFGDPSLFHLIHATRGGALPTARGPRQCAV